MSVKYYNYNSEYFCEKCAERIRASVANLSTPEDVSLTGPYSGEESDVPHHCASDEKCLSPTKMGEFECSCFLENPLTSAGYAYVKDLHKYDPTDITRFYLKFYEIREDILYFHDDIEIRTVAEIALDSLFNAVRDQRSAYLASFSDRDILDLPYVNGAIGATIRILRQLGGRDIVVNLDLRASLLEFLQTKSIGHSIEKLVDKFLDLAPWG